MGKAWRMCQVVRKQKHEKQAETGKVENSEKSTLKWPEFNCDEHDEGRLLPYFSNP